MPVDARPTIAAPDDDPYLWLEEIDGERALAWVDQQNALTLAKFGTTRFAEDRDTLAAILDRPDNIPFVTRRGPYLYNIWKDATNPRGLWRRTTLDSFRTAQPSWEILLDVDALAAQEQEDWVWHGASTLPGSHDLAILRLSRGGSDATVLREFDIAAKAFVKRRLPSAGGQRRRRLAGPRHAAAVQRLRRGHGDQVGLLAEPSRLWRRGIDVDQAPLLFETTPDSMGLWASVDRTRHRKRCGSSTSRASSMPIVWLGDRTGPKVKLDLPTDIELEAHRDWLAVKRRTPWTVGGKTYARRHAARHRAVRIHRREPRFHGAVRAGRTARPAAFLLERWTAGACRSSTS